VDEASQFYPLFGLGANVALIFSGRAVKIFSQIRAELPPDVDGWGLSLRGLMGMVVIGGLLIAGVSVVVLCACVERLPMALDGVEWWCCD
jgi:AAA family ATP:ADP antiporter